MKSSLYASVAVLAVLFAAAGAPAVAQTAAERQADKTNTIVVIGERDLDKPADNGALGDKPILDTPFSITVIDAADVAARQPGSIQQVFINDPSVFSFATPGTVNWWGTTIRGLGVRNYFIDEAPLGLYWGGDYPLEAIESVQALKGATGFMFGFGAPGGAISYRTKRSTDDPLLSTEVGFRGQSVVSGHLDAGGQIGGGLGYRVNIAGENGTEYNDAEIDRFIGALAVDYKIAPNMTLRANVAVEDYEIGAEPFHIYWNTSSPDVALPAVPDNWNNINIDNSFYRYDLTTAGAQFDWAMSDDWSAKINYGYTRKRHSSNKSFINLDELGDYEGSIYQFGELDVVHIGSAMLQGEVRTGPLEHDLVVGVSEQNADYAFGDGYTFSNDFSGNIYDPQPYLIPAGPINDSIAGAPYEERQTAIFASDTIHFGEQWQAIIGVRQTYYDQEDLDGDPTTVGYNTTATSPTVALLYKPVPEATIYASYVESMEAGGIVSDPIYANLGEVLEATISKQAEVGFKYERGAATLTAAAFRIEAAAQIDEFVGADRYLRQDGLTLYQGVEVSGDYNLTEDLNVGLGAVYLDAQYDKVSDPALEGTRPPETYEWQAVANVGYHVPMVEGLSLHGNVRYFGDAPTYAPVVAVPEYTLVSAGFIYDFEMGGKSASIIGNVNNLLNEKYWGLQNFGETINGSIALVINW